MIRAARRLGMVVATAALAASMSVVIASPASASAEATVWVDTGTLWFVGAATHPTSLTIKNPDGSWMQIMDGGNPIVAGAGCLYGASDRSIVYCRGGGSLVRVVTGDHDDVVTVTLTGTYAETGAYIEVGNGNDTVYGSLYADSIYGGPGNDRLYGGAGYDSITPGTGADTVSGGDDIDAVAYTDSPLGVIVDLDSTVGDDGAPGEGDTLASDVEDLVGSPYNDVLTGNSGDNRLVGCGGSDRLDGLGGPDELQGDGLGCGTIGRDVLIGGPGRDSVIYEYRTAALYVTLYGTTPDDGQKGEFDTIGDDVEDVSGSDGNDTLIGNASTNSLAGYGGNDTIRGVGGDDLLYGAEGNDSLDGGPGRDSLDGGGGTDRCIAGEVSYGCE